MKNVSEYFGYKYQHYDMDGVQAATMYSQIIGKRDELAVKKLLEYSRDDVMSMNYVISNLHKAAGIAPDRSWKPPDCKLPVSFEEECTFLKSLKKQGLTISEIARKVGLGRRVIGDRLKENPEEMRGKRVTFKLSGAHNVGPSLGISQNSSYEYSLHSEDRTATGTIVMQISLCRFMIKANGTIFYVSKKLITQE